MTIKVDGDLTDLSRNMGWQPVLWPQFAEMFVNLANISDLWSQQLDVSRHGAGHLGDPAPRFDPIWPQRWIAVVAAVEAAAGSLFDRCGQGMFVVEPGGRLIRANAAGEDLLRRCVGLRVSHGRLTASQAEAARRLKGLIDAASRRAGPGRGGTMALPGPFDRRPLALTVSPLGDLKSETFQQRCVMVSVTDLDAPLALPQERLQALFGLTPKECRLALALLEGLSLHEAAERFGVSPHTLHVQLARVFEKTGAGRQSDLVRLLMRLATVELNVTAPGEASG